MHVKVFRRICSKDETLRKGNSDKEALITICRTFSKLWIPLLTDSINSRVERNIFSDLAKTALVVRLDKEKRIKNDISNFGPVRILNMSKKQLLHGMEKVFLPQISAYQQNCNSQHVVIHFIEEWRK